MPEPAEPVPQHWQLSTLAGCQLAIGRYPRFAYNASGGGGLSEPVAGAHADGSRSLQFAAEQLHIPPLDWRSTRFLGLPLPPGLSITIAPEQLRGEVEADGQEVQLHFSARFRFRLALGRRCLYAAPDLLIHTTLQSGVCQGQRHRACGRPRSSSGDVVLVGIARVEPSGDPWLDRFLGLPDEALAELHCRITPQP